MVGPSEAPAYDSHPNERVLHHKPIKLGLLGWTQHNINDCDVGGLYRGQGAGRGGKCGKSAGEDTEVLCVGVR